jgi:mannose-6-phosphate isomerase-like protein (cupin superfamily)
LSQRRVVTGTNEAGRSCVASDAAASQTPGFAELWVGRARDPLEPVPTGGDPWARVEPPPGATSWRIFDLPPDEVVAAYLASRELPEVEASGFHRTDTLDYVMVLDGEVTLELDEGSVDLRSGDCVVQRGTRHAWRNRSGRPVRMAVVMVSLGGPGVPS